MDQRAQTDLNRFIPVVLRGKPPAKCLCISRGRHEPASPTKKDSPHTVRAVLFGGRKRTRTADLLRVNYKRILLYLFVNFKKWLKY